MVLADVFDHLGSILFITFVFGGWIITSVASTFARNWRKARESEHLAALKQNMIEKGMSAEEIQRVISAAPAPAEDKQPPVVNLAKKLAEHEVEERPLEEILRAFNAADPTHQQTLAQTVVTMLDAGADANRVLVAVRALSSSPVSQIPGSNDQRYTDEPASFRR
jgi:hypothetical protein